MDTFVERCAGLDNERGREAQRLHKVLEDAGVKLASVASQILGVSGRAMLEALVAGTTDPDVLVELARGRLRSKLPALREALEGRFRGHHALLVGGMLGHLDYLDEAIETLSTEIERVIAPFGELIELLDTIPGIDRRSAELIEAAIAPSAHARELLDTIPGIDVRAAETIIAEMGAGMTVFPDAAHLASWAGCSPGDNVTGGKRRPGRRRPGDRWLLDILVECAWATARTRNTYLSAQFWRLAWRIGKTKAAVAVAHTILVIAWHLLTEDCTYKELGGDYFTRRDVDRTRARAVAQLEKLGYRVKLDAA